MFTEPVSFLDNVLGETGFLCYCQQESGGLVMCRWSMSVKEKWPENNKHPMPAGRGQRTGTPRCSYTSHRMHGGPLLVKPRRSFKWNEMANCGDAYVFFDPLGSSESMLASNSQSLALYNGCQDVVSKWGLDRFTRPAHPSITLTFNTLGAGNKNHHLSRGSKYGPIRMFKNEGPLKPIPTLDKLPNSCAIVKAPMERDRYSTHGQRH